MKKVFADLHLRLNPKDAPSTSRIVAKAASLGYGMIAVPLSPDFSAREKEKLVEICKSSGVDFVSRIDLQARTRGHLLNLLRKLRRKYEIICVYCEQKEIARQAAKDRRVDLLNFPSADYTKRFLDRAEAELILSSLGAWEIDAKPLFSLEGLARTRFLSTVKREVAIAKDFKIPIVLSSGVTDEALLRKPKEMAALAGLFGLEENFALEAVSITPSSIVKRNREKLAPGFVAPGINVVKEGNDC